MNLKLNVEKEICIQKADDGGIYLVTRDLSSTGGKSTFRKKICKLTTDGELELYRIQEDLGFKLDSTHIKHLESDPESHIKVIYNDTVWI